MITSRRDPAGFLTGARSAWELADVDAQAQQRRQLASARDAETAAHQRMHDHDHHYSPSYGPDHGPSLGR